MKRGNLRGEQGALANQDSYVDIRVLFNLSKQACKAIVQTLRQGVELFGVVQRDDGKDAVDVKANKILFGHDSIESMCWVTDMVTMTFIQSGI